VVASGIAIAQEARIKLARLMASMGFNEEIPYPDIASKVKAQAYIGLDMMKLRDEKEIFLQTVIPVWDDKAREREAGYLQW
jgi:nitrite reductase (cytochrome c-552)